MTKNRYMIKEASKILQIQPHVLRYWEDELLLTIPRTEMGHRYYRKEELELFRTISELKEQGFPLKGIRLLLPDLDRVRMLDSFGLEILREEIVARVQELEQREFKKQTHTSKPAVTLMDNLNKATNSKEDANKSSEIPTSDANVPEIYDSKIYESESYTSENNIKPKDNITSLSEYQDNKASDRLEQFGVIISRLINQLLMENNARLTKAIKEDVTDNILKEVDYMLRTNQEQQEAQFQSLLDTLSQGNRSRKEIACSKHTKKMVHK